MGFVYTTKHWYGRTGWAFMQGPRIFKAHYVKHTGKTACRQHTAEIVHQWCDDVPKERCAECMRRVEQMQNPKPRGGRR